MWEILSWLLGGYSRHILRKLFSLLLMIMVNSSEGLRCLWTLPQCDDNSTLVNAFGYLCMNWVGIGHFYIVSVSWALDDVPLFSFVLFDAGCLLQSIFDRSMLLLLLLLLLPCWSLQSNPFFGPCISADLNGCHNYIWAKVQCTHSILLSCTPPFQ